jgi:uncharacterized protein (DUF697 family)
MSAEATESTPKTTSKQDPKIEVKVVKKDVPAEAKPEPAADQAAKQEHSTGRLDKANAIIHRNVLWALGAGVIPFPIVDMVAITSIQLKMLKELTEVYDLSFTSHLGKESVAALASGLGSVGLGTLIGGSLAKLLPAVGQTLGVISIPLVAAAFTRATGRVFVMHFEAGGTLLDFKPQAMREYFKKELEEAKAVVAQMQKADKPAS